MEQIHCVAGWRCGREGGGGEGAQAGQSRSVYLLFASALTARDQLALLNWALNTHIAALKLPDG